MAITTTPLQPIEARGLENEKAIPAPKRRSPDTPLRIGGSHEPSEVFRDFRDWGPITEALNRHRGQGGLKDIPSPFHGLVRRVESEL